MTQFNYETEWSIALTGTYALAYLGDRQLVAILQIPHILET